MQIVSVKGSVLLRALSGWLVWLGLTAVSAGAADHRLCSKYLGQDFWRATEVGISDRGSIILHPNRKRYLSYENEGFQEIVRTPMSFSFLQLFPGKGEGTPIELRTFVRRRDNGDVESIELAHNATRAVLTENSRRKLRGEKLMADRVNRLVRYRFEEKNGMCIPSEISVEAFDDPANPESPVVRTVVMNLALCREIDGVQRSKLFGRKWELDALALQTIWFKYQKAYEKQRSSLQVFEGRSRAEWRPNLFELGRMAYQSCESLDLGFGFPKGGSVTEILANEVVYPKPAVRPSPIASPLVVNKPAPIFSPAPVPSPSPEVPSPDEF